MWDLRRPGRGSCRTPTVIRLRERITWTCGPVSAAAQIQAAAMSHSTPLIFADLGLPNPDLKTISISTLAGAALLTAVCSVDGDGYTCVEWFLSDGIDTADRMVCWGFLEAVRERAVEQRIARRRMGFQMRERTA